MMDPALAELSRAISAADLGQRIRAARIAAGLTQAQVAGGEVTPAYISRIEDGQRRPGLQLLERMALRMGTTLHQLLTGVTTSQVRQLELQVEHAAVALGLGRVQDALVVATAAEARCEEYGDPALLAEAMRVKAEAQIAAGEVNEAVRTLEALTEQLVPDVNTLRALISLCRCYCEVDRLSQATATGDLAERMAERLGLTGLSENLQLAAIRADALLRRGDREAAAAVCHRALEGVALTEGSQLEAATSYLNASISEAAANGPTPAAIELAKVALTLVSIEEYRATVDYLTHWSTA